ncbi:hypothetical protein H4219_004222 [Mycoemilia scoparia]|uniref:Uncharacterized protein n=1 Tax=Mycoemilia scoparia TaxID=417184 RepID=A0A9W8DN60_9FUNG|nr:hypothetical protein H4219_004222 [Mycoemilia scoparia]
MAPSSTSLLDFSSIEELVDTLYTNSLYQVQVIGNCEETHKFGDRLSYIKCHVINAALDELDNHFEELLTTSSTAATSHQMSEEPIQKLVKRLKQKAIEFSQSCLTVAETKKAAYDKSLSDFPWNDQGARKTYEQNASIKPAELVEELGVFVRALSMDVASDDAGIKKRADAGCVKKLSIFIAPAIYVSFKAICGIFVQSVFFYRVVHRHYFTHDKFDSGEEDKERSLEIGLKRFVEKNPEVDMKADRVYIEFN